ncbi:MAG: C10 family peptidase [Paludibacteraceae bacterium]|nr:C10 family peptidase [Paludibacteraceae bacterium]
MKKIYTFLAIGILCLHSLSIEARTVQEASAIASSFIQLRGESVPAKRIRQASQATTVSVPVELAYTQLQTDSITPAVYVFNSENQGFVLVAAQDHARAILGYSDEGYFDENNIPNNMLFWLQMYADELAQETTNYQAMKLVAAQHNSTRLETIKRKPSADTYPTISPILGNTVWGQGKPFNNYCPTYDGQRTVTGCVATALSQIMYVHKHPTRGKGSHSYTTATKQLSVSANFGNTTYDWANMIPSYENSYTTTQANAVATLMYHVGVAADMDYTVEGSGTTSNVALVAITKYFDYDKAINILPKDYMKEDNILQTIATDLQTGRPVYFSGATINQEGHAFVCDGMRSDGYLHINWGWNGTANGYFTLSALDPEHQGTGGSTSDLAFTERVVAYTNIKPNAGGDALPLVTIDQLIRTSADEISKNKSVSFSLENFTSSGLTTAAGMVTYFIYDSNGALISQIPIGTIELPVGYYYTDPIQLSESLPNSLATGNYELEIRYVDDAGIDHPILVKEVGEVRIPFTVTNTQFIFSENSVDYSIKNLQVTTSQDTVFFSFESEAPNFHVKITKEEGDVVAEGTIDFKNVQVTELEDGNYTLWIRPVDAAKEYYIGDAVETTFTISTVVIDYTIRNLEVSTEGSTVHFSWESEAPYFHVKITQDDGTSIVNTIIDFKNAKLEDMEDGNYTLWIRPVDEAQEYYIGDAVEATFTISTVVLDYTIRNLVVTTEGSTAHFGWESDAPYFHIKITKEDGEVVAEGIIDFKNARLEDMEDGNYTLWIRPVDEAQEYYLGDAVEATFTIATIPTDVVDITSDETLYLYDLMGRLVDSKPANDKLPFDVPQSGVYILQGQKVFISK